MSAPRWAVTADPAEADRRRGEGCHVVLVVPPGADGADAVVRGGPGRLAVLVGDVTDPATLDAASELAAELAAGWRDGP